MAYIVMAYIVVAYTVMAYIVMAYIVMAQPIVSTPIRNYSVAQLGEMLSDLGLTQTEALLHALSSARKLASQLSPPRVPTHIIYSNGVPTADHFAYGAMASCYIGRVSWGYRTWGYSGRGLVGLPSMGL